MPIFVPCDNFDPAIEDRADAGLQILTNPLGMRVPITLWNNRFRQRFPERFITRPSEDRRGSRIPFRHEAGCIDGNDSVQRRVHDRSITLLTL